MSLSSDQIQTLRVKLLEQQEKLSEVLASLKAGDPASEVTRTTDNADVGTEAIESSELVAYESLERETQIMLDRIQESLSAMDAGTYGVTEEGEEIPFERLLIDPTATTTVKS